jgi:hypothetical protein
MKKWGTVCRCYSTGKKLKVRKVAHNKLQKY